MLKRGGASNERADAFAKAFSEQFGENAVLNPRDLIDSKPYLLIPADGMEVNGLPINVKGAAE